MNECNITSKVNCVYIFNASDVRVINEKDGLVLKRKYGKLKRDVFKFEPKK